MSSCRYSNDEHAVEFEENLTYLSYPEYVEYSDVSHFSKFKMMLNSEKVTGTVLPYFDFFEPRTTHIEFSVHLRIIEVVLQTDT